MCSVSGLLVVSLLLLEWWSKEVQGESIQSCDIFHPSNFNISIGKWVSPRAKSLYRKRSHCRLKYV